MNKTYEIFVHSVVDLITNSSSELFVAANRSTVNTVKELIDATLSAAGSDLRSDDLVEIHLVSKENGPSTLQCTVKDGRGVEVARVVENLMDSIGTEYIMC